MDKIEDQVSEKEKQISFGRSQNLSESFQQKYEFIVPQSATYRQEDSIEEPIESNLDEKIKKSLLEDNWD